jgi:hypothetical protein
MPPRLRRRISSWAFLCILAASFTAHAQAPQTDEEKTLYALGLAIAKSLHGFSLTPAEAKLVLAGMASGLGSGKPEVDLAAYKEKINALAKSRVEARAVGEREASTRFLAEAASQKGAKKTASRAPAIRPRRRTKSW